MKSFLRMSCGFVFLLTLVALPNRVDRAAPDLQIGSYQEDFEDGQAQGWQLEPGWDVTLDGGNHVLAGQGHVWARSNQTFQGDQRLTFRVRLLKGRIHLVVCLSDASRYFIGFDANGSDLNKQYFPDEFQHNLATHGASHSFNQWYQMEIVLQGSTIEFLVDGTRQWSYSDPQPLTGGVFAFETQDGSQVYVDDIRAESGMGTTHGATQASPAVATATQPAISSQTWVRTGGPLGGLGYDIRMRPDNPDIMYVTDANAGVHMSTDGGNTWAPINEGIDLHTGQTGDLIPVFCLTIDPNDYDIIWVGLQGLGGIYRSMDGGTTWEKRVTGIRQEGLTIRGISVEPGNSDVVYAAGEISSWEWAGRQRMGHDFDMTMGIVYKSVDGGAHWKAAWQGDNLARYIWIDPENTDTLYVSTGIFDREAANTDVSKKEPGGVGVLKSTDGGQTWRVLAGKENLTGLYIGSLFMHPERPEVLLAGAGHDYWSKAYDQGGAEISPAGVFLTEDGGETWSQTLAHEQIYSVEYCISDPNTAYAAGPFAVHKSEDGGRTWQRVSGGTSVGQYWGPPGVVAGFPIDMQCDPRNPDRIFVNNYGGGNFLSEDGGKTWQDASKGYSGAMVFGGLALDPNDPAHILAGARSGLFSSNDGGVTWSGLAYGQARHAEITSLVFNPEDPHSIISSPWDLNQLALSSDDGTSWVLADLNVGTGQSEGLRALNLVFAPSESQIIYAGMGPGSCLYGQFEQCDFPGAGVYVSRNGGRTWEDANDDKTRDLNVAEVAAHPENPDIVYAAALKDGVFMTSDGGRQWQPLALKRQVWSLAIDPSNPSIVFAGTRGGVYRSDDDGNNWKHVSGGMPPESLVRSIVINPADSKMIWAADYFSGVYFSSDGGDSWIQHNDGMTVRAVVDLAISQDGQTLYAATHGGGVFRLSAHDQDYFDALALTYLPVQATNTPDIYQAVTPTQMSQPTAPNLPCGGAGVLPLTLLGLVWWRGSRRRSEK